LQGILEDKQSENYKAAWRWAMPFLSAKRGSANLLQHFWGARE